MSEPLKGAALIAALTNLLAQEIIRVAETTEPTERLKMATTVYAFTYFANNFGAIAMLDGLKGMGLETDVSLAIIKRIQDTSSKDWDLFFDKAKTRPFTLFHPSSDKAETPSEPDRNLN